VRSTLFAMRLAERLGVDTETASQTYYACLLQHVGCTADLHVKAEIIGEPAAFMQHFMPVWFGSQREIVRAVASRRSLRRRCGVG